MSEILSQAEIEALLSSLNPDAGPVADTAVPEFAPAAAGPARPRQVSTAYEVYDFRRPDLDATLGLIVTAVLLISSFFMNRNLVQIYYLNLVKPWPLYRVWKPYFYTS